MTKPIFTITCVSGDPDPGERHIDSPACFRQLSDAELRPVPLLDEDNHVLLIFRSLMQDAETRAIETNDPNWAHNKMSQRMRSRCWGYYFDRANAEHVIEYNETDISELGYYQYAVLAELGEGPLAAQNELQWYEFTWVNNSNSFGGRELVSVRKIEKPYKYRPYMFGGF